MNADFNLKTKNFESNSPERNVLNARRNPENGVSPLLQATCPQELSSTNLPAKWYAIYTRSRFEKKLYKAMLGAGLMGFLPLVKEKRAWSDRLKTVEVPLLPSYVFVNADKAQLKKLFYCPGFVRLVSFEGKPCEVRPEEIELLQQIITHGHKAQVTAYCSLGDRVKIIRGPLKGWEGTVEEKRGGGRVVFQFDCIRQALSVEVHMGDVERV
ncbi:MAG: UpxY family transcription antiterminator [Lewinellaceae bacterium]|nr:UpxY family transcription antiterminator [Lewinellaceae bacterium]